MTKARDALIMAVDSADGRRSYTIKEIAIVVGDDKARVKPVFDRFRDLFKHVNETNKTQARAFPHSSIKALALYQVLCNELNFKSYKADELLRKVDNNLLWDHYKTGLGNLSAFAIEASNSNQEELNG